MNKKNIVIGFYGHPEYYPPTLNAIACFSGMYDKIYVIHRNYPSFDWQYPENTELIPNGSPTPIRDLENDNIAKKIALFFRFSLLLFKYIKNTKADTILLYDCIAVFAYWLIRPFVKKPAILWYHNHDVTDLSLLRKYSIGWWAWKAEGWIFGKLDIFSLPAVERRIRFPMDKLKGQFYFIPNYPSVKVYNNFDAKGLKNDVRILFQGSIAPMHGLEEIIKILNKKVNNFGLQLVLKGFISPAYLAVLNDLAVNYNAEDRLINVGSGSYQSVIDNAATCQIGIGIHRKEDIMNKTLGTASNKIYEYAASGLPVILYENAHFKEHLHEADWAFFTDCSEKSILLIVEQITAQYSRYSNAARRDFMEKYNFETYFEPVLNALRGVAEKASLQLKKDF